MNQLSVDKLQISV